MYPKSNETEGDGDDDDYYDDDDDNTFNAYGSDVWHIQIYM